MLYYQYPLLTPAQCSHYIDYYNSKQHAHFRLDWPDVNRNHSLLLVNPAHDLWHQLTSAVTQRHQEINQALGLSAQTDIKFFDVFISKYTVGEQVLWHVDRPLFQKDTSTEIQPKNPRLYNVSVNLNQDYTGGDLAVRDSQQSIRIEKALPGIATSFSIKNQHQVDTVTCGERYSLITWVYADAPEYYKGCDTNKWVYCNK